MSGNGSHQMEVSCNCQAQRPALGMLQRGLRSQDCPRGIMLLPGVRLSRGLPGSAGMPEQAVYCKGTVTYRKDDSLQLVKLLILSTTVMMS